jgi:hypothetical protein
MEHQEGAGEPRRCAREGGEPIQIAYDLRFGRSTYARKAKDINFPMAPVSCPTKIGFVRNHQNSTDFQNHFWYYATILARWAVYPVGVQ